MNCRKGQSLIKKHQEDTVAQEALLQTLDIDNETTLSKEVIDMNAVDMMITVITVIIIDHPEGKFKNNLKMKNEFLDHRDLLVRVIITIVIITIEHHCLQILLLIFSHRERYEE